MAGNTKNKISVKNIDWHEIRRKIFHILGGLAISYLIYFDYLKSWMVFATLCAGIIVSLTYKYYNIPVINFFLEKFERPYLKKTFPGKGVIFLFLAIFILMISFEKNIVLAGLMIWTFGDSVSAIVGKHYGKIKHPFNNKRLLEGTLAGVIAATIASAFFIDWNFLYAFIGSSIAMIVESIDWKIYHETLDDNLFVPVIGAFVIWLLIILL